MALDLFGLKLMRMNDRNKHRGANNKPAQMKLVKFAFPFLAIIGLLLNLNLSAQTSESKYMAGLSATFLDYQGTMTGNIGQYKTFDPGISFGAHAYINNLMNVSLNSTFIPEATYPIAADQFLGTSLIDVNTLVQFKSNGTLIKNEEARVAPYLIAGFGLNTASNNLRFYAPAGLGVRFQLTENFNFQLQSMYKFRIGKDKFQHIEHSAGFVFALPSKPENKQLTPEERQAKKRPIAVAKLPDADNDGVPDRDDLCPDTKGKAAYLGCPDDKSQQQTGIASTETETPIDTLTLTGELASTDKIIPLQELNTPTNQTERIDITEADRRKLEEAMNNIYFEKASDELKSESHAVLDVVSGLLEKYPHYDLQVLGHTDNTGNQNTNLVLSIKRAFKVKYYLVYNKGVRLSRITSDGYSSVAPIAGNDTAAGREKNRRVELKLIQSDQNKVGYSTK